MPGTPNIGPHTTVTVAPVDTQAVSDPVAEPRALWATVRELVELADALQPGPGAGLHVRSVQGLAHSVQTRMEALK
jgi:hypothetical protein